MVIGARAIKSYGWEHLYIDKVVKSRKDEASYLFKKTIYAQLGFAIFQHSGLIALFLIFVLKW